MASAIIGGLITSETYSPNDIYVMDILQAQLDQLKNKHGDQIHTTTALTNELFDQVTIVILAIKPTQIPTILEVITPFLQFKKHIIVSICAGVPTLYINQSKIHHNQSKVRHNQSKVRHNQSKIHHNHSKLSKATIKIVNQQH
jgi:pyrroline-5-carboxylate reductase